MSAPTDTPPRTNARESSARRSGTSQLRRVASFAFSILLFLLLTACDPSYRRVDRFAPGQPEYLLENSLTQFDQLAVDRGFYPAVVPQEEIIRRQLDGRHVLAWYDVHQVVDGPRGSWAFIKVLREEATRHVEMESSAFGWMSEPPFMQKLREAIAALLLDHGYLEVE